MTQAVHSAQSTVAVGQHCAGVPLFGRDCRVARFALLAMTQGTPLK
ncbi:MAG: hypothetical protein LBL66_11230 [Clostridiales bacterium]|nr:hypothetical protein [Clostridiales bacterium]